MIAPARARAQIGAEALVRDRGPYQPSLQGRFGKHSTAVTECTGEPRPGPRGCPAGWLGFGPVPRGLSLLQIQIQISL